MTPTGNLGVRALDEHLRGPARAAQQRRRAHLAAHRDRVAVRIDDVEVQIRMRIDEIDARDRALDLDGLRAIETAEAVMRVRGGGGAERGAKHGAKHHEWARGRRRGTAARPDISIQ